MSTPTRIPPRPLPKGPHALSRDEVAASQRARLLHAFTQLLAECGYAAVTIGELARRAQVSRSAFYEQFAGKEECLLAAYEEFAANLLRAMTAGISADASWEEFIAGTLDGYLGTLEAQPVAARAFLVEMEAAGESARRRRRQAMQGFAALLAQRHRAIRALDPALGELPDRVYLGLAFGVRELVHERLEEQRKPRLTELRPDVVLWITAMVEGAAAAHARASG